MNPNWQPDPNSNRPGDRVRILEVANNQEIANDIWKLDIHWDGTPVWPGTFLDLLPYPAGMFVLRRPLSVADVSDDGELISVIYRVVGAGTKAFSQLVSGQRIDVLGPLGHGFPLQAADISFSLASSLLPYKPRLQNQLPIPAKKTDNPNIPSPAHALLIGGGVGIPPLYLLGRRLKELGWQLTFHLGLRNAGEVFIKSEFDALGTVQWATDDGSFGLAGTVADLTFTDNKETARTESASSSLFSSPTVVYACGPLPMLRFVKDFWSGKCPTFLSLEERMACAMGACYACVLPDANFPEHQHRICYDGPVFAANEVIL